MTITRTSCSHRPLHRPNLVIEPGFKYMIRDRTNAALLVLGSYFLLFLAPHLGAQVSFQYDLAGNLVTQSNTVPAAPPAFQEFAPQYVGVDSDGLLTISVPVTGTGAFTYQWLFNGVALGGATNDSLLLANATALNLGKYQLVASNRGGAVTSGVFTVSFFDPDGSGLPVAWELTYFGATGVDANADPDGDGVSNYQEFLDGTDPTSANSVMPRLYVPTDPAGGTISVQPLKSKYQLGEVVQITALPEPGWSLWVGSARMRRRYREVSPCLAQRDGDDEQHQVAHSAVSRQRDGLGGRRERPDGCSLFAGHGGSGCGRRYLQSGTAKQRNRGGLG